MPEKHSRSDVENAGASGDMYENKGKDKITDHKRAYLPDPKRRFVNFEAFWMDNCAE